MKMKRLSGFSLMEMMVVLLIIAVVAAASAPMISKKMINSAAQNSSPWVWTGTTNAIAFNIKDNNEQTVTIGDVNHAGGVTTDSRLFIKSAKAGSPQIGFSDGSTKAALTIKGTNMALTSAAAPTAGNATAFGVGTKAGAQGATAIGYNSQAKQKALAIGHNAQATGTNSIAIGTDSSQAIKSEGLDSIAIGNGAQSSGTDGISLGYRSNATSQCIALGSYSKAGAIYATAVGYNAAASKQSSTAVGYFATASATSVTAVGHSSEATANYATALGYNTTAKHTNSTAVGYNAVTDANNQIMLGDKNTTVKIKGNLDLSELTGRITLGNSSAVVYIPGNLVVDWNTVLGRKAAQGAFTVVSVDPSDGEDTNRLSTLRTDENKDWQDGIVKIYNETNATVHTISDTYPLGISISDRRLKNVGDEITTGLDKIKELKIYNFTYKKDENKTPHIGVMAQDLQKVFPDAVTKGEDGFLKIRWEDMFYSMINAIKELDAKFEALVVKVQKAIDLEEEVKALRAENKELKKQFSDLEKRIEKLEKKAEKRAKKAEKE